MKPPRLPSTLRALRHPNFRLFFGGQLISLIGTWMQIVAQSWLVYRLTGSSVLLGTVSFAGQIPVLLLAAVGGTVADRYNRHRVIVSTQAASMLLAFILAALTLTGRVQIWHIVTLAALLGSAAAFDIPARQSFLVHMVGRADLMNAIALNSSMFNGARMIGPAVAGILVAVVGEGWCFFLNAVSYIAVIAGLLLMRVPPYQPASRQKSAFGDMIDGFRFVLRHAPVHALMIILGVMSVAGAPYAVLMPIFAARILHGGAATLGLLTGAAGLGALAGALTLASREESRGLGRVAAFSAGAFGLSLILFASSRLLWLSLLLLVPVGYFLMLGMASCNTLIQSMCPDQVRGRVMAIYSMVIMGMMPLGALVAGAVAERAGAPLTVAGGGGFCILAATVFGALWPRFRDRARDLIAVQKNRESL